MADASFTMMITTLWACLPSGKINEHEKGSDSEINDFTTLHMFPYFSFLFSPFGHFRRLKLTVPPNGLATSSACFFRLRSTVAYICTMDLSSSTRKFHLLFPFHGLPMDVVCLLLAERLIRRVCPCLYIFSPGAVIFFVSLYIGKSFVLGITAIDYLESRKSLYSYFDISEIIQTGGARS